jgi:hypothetical protein
MSDATESDQRNADIDGLAVSAFELWDTAVAASCTARGCGWDQRPSDQLSNVTLKLPGRPGPLVTIVSY